MNSKEESEIRRSLSLEGIQLITFPYSGFGFASVVRFFMSFLHLWSLCVFKNIHTIHTWCTPAGSMGYLLSVFTGKRLVLDSFEPHAEAMVENGTWKRDSIAFRILFFFEKRQAERAEAVIGLTNGMKSYTSDTYGVSLNNYFIKPACVSSEAFLKKADSELIHELGIGNKVVMVYAGKFGGIYLDKEVFDFIRVAASYWKNNFNALLLTDMPEQEVKEKAHLAGIPDEICVTRFVPQTQVADYLALAHFAINPVKPVPTKRYCTSIKDGEYWASGLPVVITKNISDDSEIIEKHNAGAVLLDLNDDSYASAIQKIDSIIQSSEFPAIRERIKRLANQYRNFEIAEFIYRKIYS